MTRPRWNPNPAAARRCGAAATGRRLDATTADGRRRAGGVSGRVSGLVFGLWFALTCGFAAAAAPDVDSAALQAAGLRLYRDGRLPDGGRLQGLGAGSATVATACAGCHRDSGMGGGEGNQRVVPITATDLFQAPASLERPAAGDRLPRARPGATVQPGRRLSRPGYDLATLARALRTGVDAGGRTLDALMPRYPDLDDAAVQALAAHLATLRSDTAPGWTPAGTRSGPDTEPSQGELHLATIVTPDAEPQRVRALLETLQAWQAQHQSPRVRLRPVLQVWLLEGESATWPAQLAARQSAQPVFAVLSGAAGPSAEDWRGVEDWCERSALPCLLPLVDTPPEPPPGAPAARWTLHGSSGTRLEAAALALHLRQDRPRGRLAQWFDDRTGQRAAERLSAALEAAEGGESDEEEAAERSAEQAAEQAAKQTADLAGIPQADAAPAEPVDAAVAPARWCALGEADTLVLWVTPAVLRALDTALGQGLADCAGPGRVYLSASRLGHHPPVSAAWLQRARLVSPEVDDQRLHARTAIALQPWARRSGLALHDERTQAKVHAATSWFTEALARMQGRLGRDYLMESLERTLDNRALAGPWLSVSLGPGQRVAVKSAQILQLDGTGPARHWRATGAPIRP